MSTLVGTSWWGHLGENVTHHLITTCYLSSANVPGTRPNQRLTLAARVDYAEAAGATSANTDIILYAPGRGNTAFRHVVLDFVTATRTVTFWGGTGKLRGFEARADISYSATRARRTKRV